MKNFMLLFTFIFTSHLSFAQIDLSRVEPESNYTKANGYVISNVWASARKNLRNIKEALARQNYDVSVINHKDIGRQYVFFHPTQKAIELGQGQTATVEYKIHWVSSARTYSGFYMSADLVLENGDVYKIQDVEGMEDLWQPFAAMVKTLPGNYIPLYPDEVTRVEIAN